MGGGSADAAAVLTALNMLSGGPLDASALLACGAKVGADVSFCVAGGCRLCGGKGETIGGRLRPASLFFLILKPEAGISTPAAYDVKSSPNTTSVDLFVLHEGTKVSILDEADGWSKIKIANGSVGWLQSDFMRTF